MEHGDLWWETVTCDKLLHLLPGKSPAHILFLLPQVKEGKFHLAQYVGNCTVYTSSCLLGRKDLGANKFLLIEFYIFYIICFMSYVVYMIYIILGIIYHTL